MQIELPKCKLEVLQKPLKKSDEKLVKIANDAIRKRQIEDAKAYLRAKSFIAI